MAVMPYPDSRYGRAFEADRRPARRASPRTRSRRYAGAHDSARAAAPGNAGLTGQPDLVLAAAVGAVCLALAASLWAVSVRRRAERRVAAASDRLARLEGLADATQASAEAFDSAMLTVEDGRAELAWGGDSLALAAGVLGVAGDPRRRRSAGGDRGADGAPIPTTAGGCAPCSRPGRPAPSRRAARAATVAVDGRASGALAWLRLQPDLPNDGGLPPAEPAGGAARRPAASGLAGSAAAPWSGPTSAWLSAVEAASMEDAARPQAGLRPQRQRPGRGGRRRSASGARRCAGRR